MVTIRSRSESATAHLRELFGEDVPVDQVGKFKLVHADRPDPSERQFRLDHFEEELDDIFEPACPLCAMIREEGGTVIYDEEDSLV